MSRFTLQVSERNLGEMQNSFSNNFKNNFCSKFSFLFLFIFFGSFLSCPSLVLAGTGSSKPYINEEEKEEIKTVKRRVYNASQQSLTESPEHVDQESIIFNSIRRLDYFREDIPNSDRYNLGDLGAQELSRYVLPRIEELNLTHHEIHWQGIRTISLSTESWTNLRVLVLKGNNLKYEGAAALAQNSAWINLEKLDLEDCCIGNEGARALSQNESWVKLETLILWGNLIGSTGAKELAENTSWLNLKRLFLGGSALFSNEIYNEGARALGQNKSWIKLKELDVSRNSIRDEGFEAIAQNASWINLQQLDLSGNIWGWENRNIITKIGIDGLIKNRSWKKLEVLDLRCNTIDEELIKVLKSQWPHVEVLYSEPKH